MLDQFQAHSNMQGWYRMTVYHSIGSPLQWLMMVPALILFHEYTDFRRPDFYTKLSNRTKDLSIFAAWIHCMPVVYYEAMMHKEWCTK